LRLQTKHQTPKMRFMNYANMLCKVMNEILIFATNQNNFLKEDFELKRPFFKSTKLSFSKTVSMLLTGFNASYNISAFTIAGGVSASSLCEARYKLKASIFSKINAFFIQTIKNNPIFNSRFKDKYRILAVDGTTSLLPDNKLVRASFGTGSNQHKEYAMAQIVVMVDVLNDWVFGSAIKAYKTAETEVAKTLMFNQTNGTRFTKAFSDIYVLDKLYGATSLFYQFSREKKYFITPLKEAFSKLVTAFEESSETSGLVTLKLSERAVTDLKKIGHKVSKKTTIELRLVKGTDMNGLPLTIATNILDNQEITDDEIRELYSLRWGVETTIGRIKNVLRLAHYSGKTPLSIEQDFCRKIFLYNLSMLIYTICNFLIKEQESIILENASEEILKEKEKHISELPGNKRVKKQTTRKMANFVVCKELAIMAVEEFMEQGKITPEIAMKYIQIGVRYSLANKPKRSFDRVFKSIFIRGRIFHYMNFKMNT
jgi:hypothetical protein